MVTELELAPWEIVLGVNATVQTLEGPVTIRVPAGSVPGQQLRVRGKGLPIDSGSSRGDLFAVLTISFPTEVNDAERELWKKLAELSTFNPRKRTGAA